MKKIINSDRRTSHNPKRGYALIILLTLVMTVAALLASCSKSPDENGVIDGIKYEYSDSLGGYVASADNTDIKRAKVLSNIDGKPVLALANEAFKDCKQLKSIELPDSLIRVGYSAFANCDQLSYKKSGGGRYLGNSKNPYLVLASVVDEDGVHALILEDGMKIIAPHAFRKNEKLVTVTFPESLEVISDEAFIDAQSILSISLYDGVKYIGSSAFAGCIYLESVRMPNSVTEIGEGAFAGCLSLQAIEMPSGITEIKDKTFVNCFSLMIRATDLPKNLTSIGKSAFG